MTAHRPRFNARRPRFEVGQLVFCQGRRMTLEAVDGAHARVSYPVRLSPRNCARCHGVGEALVPKAGDPSLLTYGRCPRCGGLGVIPGEERVVCLDVRLDELEEPPGDAYGQIRLV